MDRRISSLFALVSLPFALAAQEKQTTGLAAEWDIRKDTAELAAQVKRIPEVLDQAKPKDWVAKGAPEAYIRQLESARKELQYVIGSTEKLVRDPERLPAALDVLFRLQSLEALLNSLRDGVRKYQNSRVADLLNTLLTDNANNRERLRQHILDLAATREEQFQVMDQEAQRCRTELTRQPAPDDQRSRIKTRKNPAK
ncbi:MAG TPA: hypothetical protein VMZ52_09150 [Bryobacteraceae bacterium]|nr:hypothetical protein [Bryobacteraceae bacterium]